MSLDDDMSTLALAIATARLILERPGRPGQLVAELFSDPMGRLAAGDLARVLGECLTQARFLANEEASRQAVGELFPKE